jgi:hypothetical protein
VRGSRLRIAIIVVAVVVLLIALLIVVPVESTAYQVTAATSRDCVPGFGPCDPAPAVDTVGHFGYTTFSGTWLTNTSGEDIRVAIFNDGSSQTCPICGDVLYQSGNSTLPTESFDVSGFGPLYLVVTPITNGAQSTAIQGTVDASVI